VRGEAHEHRGSKANEIRVLRKEKREQRVGFHGAVFSDELCRTPTSNSRGGKAYHEKWRQARAAQERRSSEQDGEAGGELGWQE
jgi:hypothetical protein